MAGEKIFVENIGIGTTGNGFNSADNGFQFFNIIALLNIIIILSYVILFDSTLYGSWRHTYFLYPF